MAIVPLLLALHALPAATPLQWRLPYNPVPGARVSTTKLPSPIGTLTHHRVVLPAGATLSQHAASQPELLASVPVTILSAPHAFLGAPFILGTLGRPPTSTFLYLANLSALGDLLDACTALPSPVVAVKGDAFGWQGPHLGFTLTAHGDVPVADAYLLVVDQVAPNADARADLFLRMFAALLPHITPTSAPIADWPALADTTYHWLETKGNWLDYEGHRYTKAYVNSAWGSELMVQLELLEPTFRYRKATGESYSFTDSLAAGLPPFLQKDPPTVVHMIPCDPKGNCDSWVYLLNLVKLADLAAEGCPHAADLLRASLPYATKLAHTCGYCFPVFFRYSDTKPVWGEERDAVYEYIYAMGRAYELFSDKAYLDEAIAAASHIGGKPGDPVATEFGSAYELHLEGIGCAALVRLAKLTGDKAYLRASLRPLAYLLPHCATYQADWAYRDAAPTFMGLSAMPGAYCAPMEQHVAAWYLGEALRIAGRDFPAYARRIASTFLSFSAGPIRYAYPDRLPPHSLAAGSPDYNIANDASCPIPVEDYRWDRDYDGMVGQEIYGDGAAADMALLAATYPSLRSTTREPSAYIWPRAVSLTPGHAADRGLCCASVDVTAELDGTSGLAASVVKVEGVQVVRISASREVPPGDQECILWLHEAAHWHALGLQIHVMREVHNWSPNLLRRPEVWSQQWNGGLLSTTQAGLRIEVAPGRKWASRGIPDVLLPAGAKQVSLHVAAISPGARLILRLSSDWNGDGRWPGWHDDWDVWKALTKPGEARAALAPWIRAGMGMPLRFLQLALEGPAGSYAVVSAIDFTR